MRQLLVQSLLKLYSKRPQILSIHQDLNIQAIGDWMTPGRRELIIALCWAVGTYSSPQLLGLTSEVVAAYYEVKPAG